VKQIHSPSSELIGGFSLGFRKQRTFSQFIFTDENKGTLEKLENTRHYLLFSEAYRWNQPKKKEPPPEIKNGRGSPHLIDSATFG
jgi:hypothetical protein